MNNINPLNTLTASTFALALKTQNFHWNVQGINFAPLHAMFEEQYDALYEQVDVLAERVRALGQTSLGGLQAYLDVSIVKDAPEGVGAEDMIAILAQDHQTLSRHLVEAAADFGDAKDAVTEDMLIGMAQEHDKTVWMLKAHLV